jgi:hypothetical protein
MKPPLLRQSDGKQSISYTMMVIGFVIVSLWLVVSIVETAFGIPIREFDSGQAMAYFTPLCALYFSRRYTDARHPAATTATRNMTRPEAEEKEEDA